MLPAMTYTILSVHTFIMYSNKNTQMQIGMAVWMADILVTLEEVDLFRTWFCFFENAASDFHILSLCV